MKKDLVSIADLDREEIEELFKIAVRLKKEEDNSLYKKTLALVFEKPSLRTRVTFSVAMFQLGGNVVYLAREDIKIGERESIKDVARNLSRWVDVVAARTYKHETIEELAKYAKIPVINALSDKEHPCQTLGDFLTIKEKFGKTQVKLAYIGDGNNVCHSLLLSAALLDTEIWVASPKGYEPEEFYVNKAIEFAKSGKAKIVITNDPKEAVRDAEVIYTDVWASMGQEHEREKRKKVFSPYQVNKELLKYASPNYTVMHCLPAHRGEEITDEVLDDEVHSVVLDQAENRLHIEKAILLKLIKRKNG